MAYLSRAFLLVTAALLPLSACEAPGGAGSAGQIISEAKAENADFTIVPVTRDTLGQLAQWPATGRQQVGGWITRSRGPASQIIAAGDKIDLSIWDNEETSLLAQPQQKVVSMAGVQVSPRGTVFLPYVDEVYVAKMTPDEARVAIQEKFVSIIPSAQVQLNHVAGRLNSVDLVSGVAKPGSYVMPDRDFTVLSLIAQGGGIPESIVNPQIRLMRDGKLFGISRDKLLANPSLDTTLRGGDKIYVETDKRYFLALGAAGKEAQIPFPTDTITALDALSLVGGVNDQRGDPKGVLVLRDYPASAVRSDGTGPDKQRMVFAIDLTSADGLFSAGKFAVHDGDLVLVTESAIMGTQNTIRLLYEAFGIGIRADQLTN